MSKIERFNNVKEFINRYQLDRVVEKVNGFNNSAYGKFFECHVTNIMKSIGCSIRKTTPEYDIIKGADIRYVYEGGSILLDIKLSKKSAFNKDRYINEFFIKDSLELSRNNNDIFYYPLTEGLEVGFILRRGKITKYGRSYFNKHILVAVFNMTDDSGCSAHDLFNESCAKEFSKYIKYINETLVREGMPAKDKHSFTFVKGGGYKKRRVAI